MHPLEEALELAARGLGATSPNPAVGAVIVADGGDVVGRGYHVYSAMRHAEIVALEEAGPKARGATVYTTLEPCSHTGRTGPCADALIAAGVAKVVSAMEDPNPEVHGKGFEKLRAAGIAVELDANYEARAREMNEPFIHFMTTGRPLVTLKAAVTLDGKIAAPDDGTPGQTPGWITSETARAHVQTLRHRADAILTGIGTVLADDCRMTDRTGLERSRPLIRIVVDSQLRLPMESFLVTSCRDDVLVVTTSAASEERRKRLESAGVRVEICERSDGRVNLPGVVGLLAKLRYQSLMIEAGSRVNWAVLEAGVADKIFFYYAPKILGGLHSLPVAGGVGRRRRKDALQFHNVRLHTIGSDEFAVEAWLCREA
jgi:diaminohydroxyphosphoribosylaminopyrimidine deaminase/5-amino-6-(5-phosphoribosylamino)uracil reductase